MKSPNAPGAFFFGAQLRIESSNGKSVNYGVNGRGIDCQGAFESCIGEAIETVNFHRSITTIVDCLEAWPKWPEEHAMEGRCHQLGLDTGGRMPAVNLSNGRSVRIPQSLIYRDISGASNSVVGSEGCAVGKDIEHARLNSILELIERDAYALWWFGGKPANPIKFFGKEEAEISHYTRKIRGDSVARKTLFLDITTDVPIATVTAISFDAAGKSLSFGFSSGGNLVSACKKAFLELVQMEIADELVVMRVARNGGVAMTEKDEEIYERRCTLSLDKLSELDVLPESEFKKPSASEISTSEELLSVLNQSGFDVIECELTNERNAIPSVKALSMDLQPSCREALTPRLANTLARFHHDGFCSNSLRSIL